MRLRIFREQKMMMGHYLQVSEGGGHVPVDDKPPGLDLAVQALEEDLEAHGVAVGRHAVFLVRVFCDN